MESAYEAKKAKAMMAIEEAKKAAEASQWEWEVEVEVEKDGVEKIEVRVVFSARASEMDGAECDAPWKEYGGDSIVAPLEKAGFRQSDAFINTYERRTFGGGSVHQYEDGVIMKYEIDRDE